MNHTDTTSTPRSWYVLALLTVVYALNIADRYVVSTVLEPIRLELALSDSQVGLITGVALALFYVTVGIPIAVLADRANRRNILAVALAIWSAMTAACGLAHNVWQFALARVGVGIGEAGGTPPSTSILADRFAPRYRPAAFTIFALGAPLGAWIGSELAGAVAQHYGWRAAFQILGLPGLLVALLVYLTIREPPRGTFDAVGAAAAKPGLGATLKYLARRRAAVHLILGGTIATLWGWGLMWWTPAFLMRAYGLSTGAAGAALGPMHLIAGTAATLATSFLVAPRMAADPRRIVWLLAAVVAAATIPSVLVYWTHSLTTAIALLWVVVPAVYFFIGPTLGLLQNVVPPTMRAQAVAVLLFTANVANLIIAPQLVGLSSDWLAPALGGNTEALRWSLLVLTPTGLWAAYHFWASARWIRQEQAEISGEVPIGSDSELSRAN
jgi:predicted MFS family arabinose efflux permease